MGHVGIHELSDTFEFRDHGFKNSANERPVLAVEVLNELVDGIGIFCHESSSLLDWKLYPRSSIIEELCAIQNLDDKSNYLDAVDNCLRFGNLFQFHYRSEAIRSIENPEDTCRRIIRTEIVPKLLMDLPIFKKPLPKRERFSNNEERFQDGKEKLLDLAYDSDSDSQSYGRYHAAPPANTTHKSVKSIVSVMPKAKICLTSPSETDQQGSYK
ncbi:uncharacterized protein DFL_002986 [Arthrobotrys flagrans]|uniref:DUF7580 domain-containing protein n=1 Tax=Arthrobotrys flagrans TaxID=97331 RepID=A0A437AC24_ARTFL|nr:hypothetical protein DFL_002986 [Arthrobotrys flagrans]